MEWLQRRIVKGMDMKNMQQVVEYQGRKRVKFITKLENVKNSSSSKARKTKKRKKVFDENIEPSGNSRTFTIGTFFSHVALFRKRPDLACKYLKGGLKFMSALATAMQALEWKGGLGFINWLRCEPHQILRPVFMLIFYHWHSTNTKYSRGGKQHIQN